MFIFFVLYFSFIFNKLLIAYYIGEMFLPSEIAVTSVYSGEIKLLQNKRITL